MSTSVKLYLKSTTSHHIQSINCQLQKLGYPAAVYDGIVYGPFPSAVHLEHYAEWLTHDPEGQKEIRHFDRPITSEFLQSFHWNEIGCFFLTLNGMSPTAISECQILFDYAFKHPHLFDWVRSNCHQVLLQEYGFQFSRPTHQVTKH